MPKLIFLTKAFYSKYTGCNQIEQKEMRPYIRVSVVINGVLWAIPLRSNIDHPNAIWTDKENKCGIDMTKAVVVEDPEKYISSVKPHIRPNEFKVLKRINNYTIEQKLKQHIQDYKDAKLHPEITRNKNILKFSTLQYFEQYI